MVRSTGDQTKAILLAAVCSAQLFAGAACADPGYPNLPAAIAESGSAAYPVLKALPKDDFPAFADKIGTLLLGIKPERLTTSLEAGIDVYLSVPSEKVDTFNAALKDAMADLKPESCDLVPLPSPAFVSKFTSSEAFAKVDAERVQKFNDKWGATLKALPKTDAAICLPPPEKLEKLALAQAEVGRAFGAPEAKRFNEVFGAAAKVAIPPGKILPLVGEGQKMTMGASLKERQRFKAAGGELEKAAKVCTALPKKCGFE